jgi:hypothetical protein
MATLPTPTPTPTPKPTPAPLPSVGAPAPAPSTGMIATAPPPAAAPTAAKPAATPKPAAAPVAPNTTDTTVEGRLGNLLKTDEHGTYQHQLVRQAVDRQGQHFNSRGLLNSSMAAQAGQEAAISKALEIAGADAQNAQRLDEQDYTLRDDYRSAVETVNNNYQATLDGINRSGMTPEDKSVAIAQAQAVRDGELAYQNNLFSKMPRWKNEWLTVAVPTGAFKIDAVGNLDTLQNIINDPAQSAANRAAAKRRLDALGGVGGAGALGGAGGGMIGAAPAGYLPADPYEAYRLGGGMLPRAQWQALYGNARSGLDNPGPGVGAI